MERCTKHRARCILARTQFHWRAALLLVASFPGCGGLVGSGPPPPPPPNITITVTPASVSVPLGESQTFIATVGGTPNTAVNWSVNGTPGGNAMVGTIDAGGSYTAPGNLPASVTVTVTATSAADPSKSSGSLVTITSDISVSASPQFASLELGASRPFTAVVSSAGKPNRGVTWIASGSGCAGDACGTIDSSGTYTAPQILPAPPAISLTAISVADPSKTSAATIAVTSSFSVDVAGPASVFAGSSATYVATLALPLNSNPSRAISWSVRGPDCTGVSCGTISSTGVFTPPGPVSSAVVVQIVATPLADASKASFFSVSVVPMINDSILPSASILALGAVQTFQATVTGTPDATVTWDVNGIVGGNAVLGSIQNSQTDPNHTTYISPQTMPAGGSVTVHARSNADPSVSASATVGFTGVVNVSLAPASATLAVGERQTFAAVVNNEANQNVDWQVNAIPGGNSVVGQICASGSNPCRPVTATNGGSVDYIAPAGSPSPDPVTITAASQTQDAPSGSAQVTILPHIVVSVQPGSVSLAATGQQRFTAAVTGTNNQQVFWTISGVACGVPAACGSIDLTGLYTGPTAAPSPDRVEIVATSSEDIRQSGRATLTISSGPAIFSLRPTSAYAGSAGGFTLLISGNNFSLSDPGPGSTILLGGAARATSCPLPTQCITSMSVADLVSAGGLSVQLQNPDGTLSNTQTFVVLAPGTGIATIPLTPSEPASPGNDIVVVELSTNGGSGAPGNVDLTIGAVGNYAAATSSCALGGNPVTVTRPASGIGTANLCVFSVSALDPSFQYTFSGPETPDITVISRERLGLGLLHLTLQVPSTAAPGPRTLFVENAEGDKAAGTGVIEVQ